MLGFWVFDFITLDDGEVPLEELITNIEDPNYNSYKRTFLLEDGKVVYKNNSVKQDYKQSQLGTRIILTCFWTNIFRLSKSWINTVCGVMAVGTNSRWRTDVIGEMYVYDISLDYIKIYEPIAASLLCDRMEEMMAQTGKRFSLCRWGCTSGINARFGTRDPQEKIIRDVVDEHSIRKSFPETCACCWKHLVAYRFWWAREWLQIGC
jgi:hypothetical protein